MYKNYNMLVTIILEGRYNFKQESWKKEEKLKRSVSKLILNNTVISFELNNWRTQNEHTVGKQCYRFILQSVFVLES